MSERAEVAAAARRLADEGLLIGTSGNVSRRAGEGRVAITGSGVVLADCTPDEVVVVDVPDPGVGPDGPRPSSELALHLGVYAAHPEVAAVVHTHSPYATAVACVLDELPVVHYQQLLLGGAIRVAAHATFGTPELAQAVGSALDGRQAALMANHGAVAVGGSLEAAVEHALLLEWLATLHHRASALGAPRVLTEAEQADVVRVAIELSYGEATAT